MANNENQTNKSEQYTGAKFSQHIYQSGSVDNIHNLREERVDEKANEKFWGEMEKKSHYDEVQTISSFLSC